LSAKFETWKAAGYDVTAKRFDNHATYSASSLPSLAVRMQVLEELIGKIRLYNGGSTVIPTTPWASGATGTPLRVLAEAYPPGDGGTDRAVPGERRIEHYQSELVPWSAMPDELKRLPAAFGARLQEVFGRTALMTTRHGLAQTLKEQKQFSEAIRGDVREIGDAKARFEIQQMQEQKFQPTSREDAGPSIRQLVTAGRYEEATAALVMLGEGLRTLRGRPEGANAGPTALEWAAKVQNHFEEFTRAQRSHDAQASSKAKTLLETLFQERQSAEIYTSWLAAGQALADVTYLTAVSKIDQAEARWRKSPDADATKTSAKTAQQIWEQFAAEHPESTSAGHALRLRARSQALAGMFKPAAESYKKASEKLSGLEKAACTILADELSKR
jgi:hypothetical protein